MEQRYCHTPGCEVPILPWNSHCEACGEGFKNNPAFIMGTGTSPTWPPAFTMSTGIAPTWPPPWPLEDFEQ